MHHSYHHRNHGGIYRSTADTAGNRFIFSGIRYRIQSLHGLPHHYGHQFRTVRHTAECVTDSRGLRRSCDDYLVAMGTGWLTEGCGDRFQVTLESGSVFTVRVGDIKADQHTDSTHRYRSCADGANVLEFIVETESLSDAARTAGTVSVYPELSGNIAAIEPISTAQ